MLQPSEWKPQSQKSDEIRWLRNMSQIKKQGKTLEEQLSEVEVGNIPGKKNRSNDSEYNPRS